MRSSAPWRKPPPQRNDDHACHAHRHSASAIPGGQFAEIFDGLSIGSNDLTQLIRHAADRVISVLEGGYNLAGLASAVSAHVRVLSDEKKPASA